MSSIAQPPAGSMRGRPSDPRISRYEQVSAFLVAMTVFFGILCTVLFLIWLTTIVRIRPTQAVVEWNDELAGNNNNPEGIAEDFEEPGVEEMADVPEPQLADAVEAMTQSMSSVQAHLEAVEGNAAQMGSGRGLGDARESGPGNGGDRVDKPWDRWQIRYSTASQKEYAEQLDSFGIELGAISQGTPDIKYLSNLANATATRRGGTKSSEKRIFFSYRKGQLLAWDKQFFRDAGVDISDRLLVQFYPNATRQQLDSLEQAALKGRRVAEVKNTIFGVRALGRGRYEYYVVDVIYK